MTAATPLHDALRAHFGNRFSTADMMSFGHPPAPHTFGAPYSRFSNRK